VCEEPFDDELSDFALDDVELELSDDVLDELDDEPSELLEEPDVVPADDVDLPRLSVL
jgi:hypothetical protein